MATTNDNGSETPIADQFKKQVESMRPKMPEEMKALIKDLKKPQK